MKSVNCPYCGAKCIRHGKNSSGTQRWFCPECKSSFTPKIDNSSKPLNMFLKWLFGRSTQGNMPGGAEHFVEIRQSSGTCADMSTPVPVKH